MQGGMVALVTCVVFNNFSVNSGTKKMPHHRATQHEHRCERRIKS